MDPYTLVPSRALLDHTPPVRPHIPLGTMVMIVTGEKIPWGWRGLQPQEGLDLLFFGARFGCGQGGQSYSVPRSQLVTTAYSVCSHSRFIL